MPDSKAFDAGLCRVFQHPPQHARSRSREQPARLADLVRLAGSGIRWRAAPDSLDARIVVGEAPQVRVEEKPVTRVPSHVTFRPFSVTLNRRGAEGGLAGVPGYVSRHGIGFSSRIASPCKPKDAV